MKIKSNVYFKEVNARTSVEEVQGITKDLLQAIIDDEQISLEKEIPLKVHFGEKGNVTYIKPANYDGIIDFLEERQIESSFMETSVLYGGHRHKKDIHLETAKEHGFIRLPIIIADGDHGENFQEVQVNLNHFSSCKIGAEFLRFNQMIVTSHFKGHALAGFGGAIKQLSMGFASKGGKMAMHLGTKPRIRKRKCVRCHLCEQRCNANAITIGEESFIDPDKCVGCGACVSICPHKAVSLFSFQGLLRMIGIGNPFKEKLVEYAYAAHINKRNIYLNFAMSITKNCDCDPKRMKPMMEDIGIFVSTDPVAIDKACYDMVASKGKKLKGFETFKYAQRIGLGSMDYALKRI